MPRIACVQTRPRSTFEKAEEELLPLVSEAIDGDADLVCLPEYCGGLKTVGARLDPPATREADHPTLNRLIEMARAGGTWILIGSIAVRETGGKILNRSYILDNSGGIVARYDKIHLFDIKLSEDFVFEESAVVEPGNQAVIADTPAGRVGLTICYDLRFPQLYRCLAQQGAEILAVPAAFTKVTGEAHWHVLNRARAIENSAYVVSPCATGKVPGGGECYGHSLAIDPWGELLVDGGTDTGVHMVDISLEMVHETRRKLPSLEHDRSFSLHTEALHKVA